jgi:hypothetical protein
MGFGSAAVATKDQASDSQTTIQNFLCIIFLWSRL